MDRRLESAWLSPSPATSLLNRSGLVCPPTRAEPLTQDWGDKSSGPTGLACRVKPHPMGMQAKKGSGSAWRAASLAGSPGRALRGPGRQPSRGVCTVQQQIPGVWVGRGQHLGPQALARNVCTVVEGPSRGQTLDPSGAGPPVQERAAPPRGGLGRSGQARHAGSCIIASGAMSSPPRPREGKRPRFLASLRSRRRPHRGRAGASARPSG